MCQLSYIHTHDKEVTQDLMYWLLLRNSDTQNKDGYGLFSPDTYWFYRDNVVPAADILNFYEKLYKTKIGSQSIFGHVRAASLINGKRTLDITKNHPFIRKSFALFHNGTMNIKSYLKDLKIPEDKTDSEFFSERVQIRIETGLSLIEAVKKEYEECWDGKFAFLLFDLITKTPYIIRGASANLYRAKIMKDGEQVGTVVNTEKDTLEQAFMFFKWARISKGDGIYSLKDIEFMPINSIHRVDGNELILQEEFIKETYEYSKSAYSAWGSRSYPYGDSYEDYDWRDNWKRNLPENNKGGDIIQVTYKELKDKFQALEQFMRKNGIGLRGMDIISRMLIEIPLMELGEKDLDNLLVALVLYQKDFNNLPSKHKKLFEDTIDDIISLYGTQEDFCDGFNLQFPIQSNEFNRAKKAHDKLIRDI